MFMAGLISAGIAGNPNLIENGGFDSDTAWVKGAGWSISGGVANKAANNISSLSQDVELQPNTEYSLIYSIVSYSGSNTTTPRFLGGTATITLTGRNTPGTYEESFVTGSAAPTTLQFVGGFNANVSIDNVSLTEA